VKKQCEEKSTFSWYCLKVEQAKLDMLVQLWPAVDQRELRGMRSKPTGPFC